MPRSPRRCSRSSSSTRTMAFFTAFFLSALVSERIRPRERTRTGRRRTRRTVRHGRRSSRRSTIDSVARRRTTRSRGGAPPERARARGSTGARPAGSLELGPHDRCRLVVRRHVPDLWLRAGRVRPHVRKALESVRRGRSQAHRRNVPDALAVGRRPVRHRVPDRTAGWRPASPREPWSSLLRPGRGAGRDARRRPGRHRTRDTTASTASPRRSNARSSPSDLPSVDGFALAARYLPAEAGFKAGGDWYDVIPLAGGRSLVVVIGDVSGHGLRPRAYGTAPDGGRAPTRSRDTTPEHIARPRRPAARVHRSRRARHDGCTRRSTRPGARSASSGRSPAADHQGRPDTGSGSPGTAPRPADRRPPLVAPRDPIRWGRRGMKEPGDPRPDVSPTVWSSSTNDPTRRGARSSCVPPRRAGQGHWYAPAHREAIVPRPGGRPRSR